MREIKFRALGGTNVWHHSEFNGLDSFFRRARNGDLKKETISQYTGLKDKNGKEIYEGDIVLWDGGMNKYCTKKAVGKVVWGNGRFFIELIKEGEYIYEDREPTEIDFEGPEGPMYWWNGLEIIGNIYENPDLLEKTK